MISAAAIYRVVERYRLESTDAHHVVVLVHPRVKAELGELDGLVLMASEDMGLIEVSVLVVPCGRVA